ncbi:hypothetical protein C8R48DRAFT_394279 [Suillus tomentosus]|nr:hypothetical protein C8R48DRAFT_394279 [Suillus tomentosus]
MIIRVQLISPESRLGDLQTLQVATPMLESPTKKRRIKADVTDLDVWDKTDDEIITASKARWNSAAYDHFKITLHRRLKVDGSRDYLEFKFTCHTDPVNHKPHHRKRMQTSHERSWCCHINHANVQ